MADKKLTDLTAITVPDDTADVIYIVDNPSSTADPRKITLENLWKIIGYFTAYGATVDDTADKLAIFDDSATATKTITLAKIYAAITATTSPSFSASLGQDVAFVLACQSYG
jgi:hypothetical protein